MQPRHYNPLALMLLLGGLLFSPLAHPKSLGEMMQLEGFRNVVMTIAIVNRAMRDAAENPMDEWRRLNVRHAIGLMPGAIIGLAQEFQDGKLKDGDLPMAQAVLGGFIDTSAGERYKKFMKSPDKSLIPQTGAAFPRVTPPPAPYGPSGTLVASAAPMASAPGAPTDDSRKNIAAGPLSPELVDLGGTTASRGPEPQGKASNARIGYDDSVAKPGARSGADSDAISATTGRDSAGRDAAQVATIMQQGAVAAASAPASQKNELLRDLSTVESQTSGAAADLRSLRRSEPKKDDDFFTTTKLGEETELGAAIKAKRPRAAKTKDYRIQAKPKFWTSSPLLKLMQSICLPDAEAAKSGGGQGGQGGEEKGGGEKAAQILFGVAAIIAAIAPMVVASTQAKADVAIAGINANTQITMTKITSETSKQLADKQKEVALTQSNIAADISRFNNNAVTDRLEKQLAELRAARQDAQQAEREKRQLELEFQNQRIALAQKQADDQLKLAKETLNAQLTQAGLSQGFSNSRNAGNQLGVTNLTTSVAGAGSAGASLGGSGTTATTGQGVTATNTSSLTSTSTKDSNRAVADTAGTTSVASGAGATNGTSTTSGTSSGATSSPSLSGGGQTVGAKIARNITSSQSSGAGGVGGGADKEDDFFKATDPRRKLLSGTRGVKGKDRSTRGVRADGIAAMVKKPGIEGSSRGFKQTSKTDLEKFIEKNGASETETSTFAGFQKKKQAERAAQADESPARGIRTANGGVGEASKEAYRTPDVPSSTPVDLSALIGGHNPTN